LPAEPSPALLARAGRAAAWLPFAAKYREYDGDPIWPRRSMPRLHSSSRSGSRWS